MVHQSLRPLRRHRLISIASLVLHFLAFLLLLLVGLSTPIIRGIYILDLKASRKGLKSTTLATELKFGVWGVCASSVLQRGAITTSSVHCFGPKLGYDIPPDVVSVIGLPQSFTTVLSSALLAVLILHLIAAGLALLAFLSSLYLHSQALSIVGLVFTVATSLLATVMFAVDISIVEIVRSEVDKLTNGKLAVLAGNGVWMALTAAICSWIGVVVLSARVCYCLGVRRKDTPRTVNAY